jgi:hypothetical protein
LAPKQGKSAAVALSYPLTREQFDSLVTGKTTFYVLGRIDYVDIYSKPRWTTYRLMTGGAVGISGNALSATVQGDDMN